MAQLSTILRVRRALLRNRLSTHERGVRKRLVLGILLAGAAVVAGGYLAAPAMMEPPVDLATPRGLAPDALPAGAAALEVAFWLTVVIASVLNFRVLELLFRRPDIQALRHLPVEPRSLFVDRLLAALTESVLTAAAASLFFLPLLLFQGGPAALASSLMLLGGLLLSTLIAFVVSLFSTKQLVPDSDRPAGPEGQILLYAPAVSMAGIIVATLFWKLLLGEPLRLGRFSEPFLIGSAMLAALAVWSLATSYSTFRKHYYAMAARFQETDAASFQSTATYQKSSFGKEKIWGLGLSGAPRTVFLALTLDDDRRIAGGRVGYGIVFLLALVGLWSIELSAMPFWAVALVPAVLFAVVVNPWHRLLRRTRCLENPMALPADAGALTRAALRGALREYYFFAAPFAVAIVALLFGLRGAGPEALLAAGLAIVAGTALSGGLRLLLFTGALPYAPRVGPLAVLGLLLASAVVSLPISLALAIILSGALLLPLSTTESRRVPA